MILKEIKEDMGLFLETHIGECGFGGYFYDQEKESWSGCLNWKHFLLCQWGDPIDKTLGEGQSASML